MKEAFLHFLWKSKRFDPFGLKSTTGAAIKLLNYGMHNDHAGPDFLNGQLEIDGILWCGNIEMHVKSSQWYQHAHDCDPAYDNVILHVVLEDDRPVKRVDGSLLPTLIIKDRVPPGLIRSYQRLMNQSSWIPCQHSFRNVKDIILQSCLDHSMVNRLERKTVVIREILEKTNWDWEEVFYLFLAKNFGLKVNAIPFYMLAQNLSSKILLRHRDKIVELEALLFGQAGMLEKDFVDEYPKRLKQLYKGFKNKYKLQPIPMSTWKYLRLRPANFPTIRIAQFARLIHQSNHLFSKVLAIKNIKEGINMFDVEISHYWKDHFVFDKLSKVSRKKLGANTIHLFIINTIVPFLFLYGKRRLQSSYQELALDLLTALPAEKNSIISGWEKLGVTVENAQHSQALIELKTQLCVNKKCLSCKIGNEVLKNQGLMKTIKLPNVF